MLARKFRLTGGRDFKEVEAKGNTFQSQNFGIAYLDRGDKGPPRFAFVVSTKISKEAVDRNTIKRHMSETVRLMVGEVKDGLDVVFLAKTTIMRIPADEIVREVRAAVRSSGITKLNE
jgi:ribonuclease P protein component